MMPLFTLCFVFIGILFALTSTGLQNLTFTHAELVHHCDDFKMSRKPVDRVIRLRITGFNNCLSFLPPARSMDVLTRSTSS